MSSGLLALLDDVAALVKSSAVYVDDITTQAGAAGSKAAGVVIDDAAVTPKYVVGLNPERELPIIWNIAKGSIKNKILFLMPAALLAGALVPWIIVPVLACGGLYLCFEGYEKIHHYVHTRLHKQGEHGDELEQNITEITPEELEKNRTASAIRTDFILSAEIMAISYAEVADQPLVTQIIALLFVALGITAFVYGAVGLIVKTDDIGIHLVKTSKIKVLQLFGRGLLKAMPPFLKVLTIVGTAAMLWVGGGIILHAIPALYHPIEEVIHALHFHPAAIWLIQACVSALFGLIVGGVFTLIFTLGKKIFK